MLLGLALLLTQSGCTSPQEFISNGFKIGPNYKEPPTPVADDWIKAEPWNQADAKMPYMSEHVREFGAKKYTVAETLDKMSADEAKEGRNLPLSPKAWTKTDELVLRRRSEHLSDWWTVFNDPMLDKLVCLAYHQNYSLRQAAYQVLAARAQLGIAIGNFLPQSQDAFANFQRSADSTQTAFSRFIPKRFFNQFNYNFNLAWEIDLWGKFRRGIENAEDTLDATLYNYDDVLVTLISDVATYYVSMRVYEERIRYARKNVIEQQKALERVELRKKVGVARQLDVDQVRAVLYQTAATIPQLEIGLRTANTQLCLALGIPMTELRTRLGPPANQHKAIPYAPPEVAVGIPADLLRQRPDVRMAERQAAAQCAEIGYAEADFYPHFSILGSFGWSAEIYRNLFNQKALTAVVGPQFEWDLFQYGRIINNVRTQDATFQSLVAQYQNTVLTAQQEVEAALVVFLKSQQQTQMQEESVKAVVSAHGAVLAQYETGLVDISQLVLILQQLAQQQDLLAQAQGQVALGLVQVYTALGGGWELRNTGCPLPEDCTPGPDPTEPLRQRGCFLPYPRVLKESTLPVHDGGHPVSGQTSSASAPQDSKTASSSLEKKIIRQPFEKIPAASIPAASIPAATTGQGGKNVDADPFRQPTAQPINQPADPPMSPRPSAQIGIPQVEPPISPPANVAPGGPSAGPDTNPVPVQVAPLPVIPVPATPAPASPAPTNPVPLTPARANPVPVTPAPANPTPVTPADPPPQPTLEPMIVPIVPRIPN